jgi:aminoglycoside phosphotransferase (APT) family kinase protein
VDELASRLGTLLGGQVSDLTRLSGGASRETWRFVLAGRPLILQRQRAGSDRDMTVEAAVLRAARAAGVPAAEVVADSASSDELGAPFLVLSAVEGETIARRILRDDEYEPARRVLAAQLGRAAARLHAIDPAELPMLAESDQLREYRQMLDLMGEPHPTFELAFRWLEHHRPPPGRRTVVHGDFRLGNVIVGHDGLRAVIDWELAHIGDPLEDLGWLCVRAWRFGAALPVAGVGRYDDLFEAYASAGGGAVDVEAARWWEVLGTLKWGIMCMMQAHAHLSGISRSHELAAIGRRVCENEHDLFLALEGRW